MTTPDDIEALRRRWRTEAADLRARATADLAMIREQWGDLLAAIEESPTSEWPPSRADRVRPPTDEPTETRVPLILREHPAPLNLAALSAAEEVERELFAVADRIARHVQRAAVIARCADGTIAAEQPDANDPRRWHSAGGGVHGSRVHGLHWACVWLEGRLHGEEQPDDAWLFTGLTLARAGEVAAVARRARRAVESALAHAGRRTVLADPCPWCRGELVAHTVGAEAGTAAVSCGTGAPCPAPVVLSGGVRVWQGADLVGLYAALAEQRDRAA